MTNCLNKSHFDDENIMEIGIDEAGRGPLFGRVYAAAVILPKDCKTFQYTKMKDSKKFSSSKKRLEVSNYIKENSIWAISYSDELYIDKHNIRQATLKAMHNAIQNIFTSNPNIDLNKYYLLVDGNDFKPYTYVKDEILKYVPHLCIEKGDNHYASIAAASILAKVAHDQYIDELCERYPKLNEYYDLKKNKGYGTSAHIEGINKYGISDWHRKTYNRCKHAQIIPTNNLK